MKNYIINKLNFKEFFKFERIKLLIIITLVITQSFLSTYPIKLIGYIVDEATSHNGTIKGVLLLSFLFFILHLCSGLFTSLLDYYMKKLENIMGHKIRCSIFSHMCKLPESFFTKENSSEILTKLLEDSNITIDGFIKPIILIGKSTCTFIIGLYLMISISLQITLLLLPIGFISSYIAYKSGFKFESFAFNIRTLTDAMWKNYSEGIRGIKEIRANCRTKDFIEKVEISSLNVCNANIAESKFSSMISFINTSFFMGVIALIMAIGSINVILGTLSIGNLTSIMMYNGLLINPIQDFIHLYNEIKKINVSIKRVNSILMESPDPCYTKHSNSNKYSLEKIDSLSFKNIDFQYDSKQILKNISFFIPSGSRVAFVGETGSGKSTILKLLTGAIHQTKGSVFINHSHFSEYSLNDIRKNISTVFQDVFIFDSSIKENIMFGNPLCTEEDYIKAIRISKVDKLISSLPQGDNTIVGENGSKLSGGEKQRIGIARALIRNSQILILDEATSALDNTISKDILKGIKDNYCCTCIMVAHRISTIEDCDCIFVVHNGTIVEYGTHQRLMSLNSFYSKLYNNGLSK